MGKIEAPEINGAGYSRDDREIGTADPLAILELVRASEAERPLVNHRVVNPNAKAARFSAHQHITRNSGAIRS